MESIELKIWHALTVTFAFIIATVLLVQRKGTEGHRQWGQIFMLLMMLIAITTLVMPATIGPRLFNHFGPLHLLSVLILYAIPAAFYSVKTGNILAHKRHILVVYFFGFILAGTLALMPNRFIHVWLWGS